MDRPSGFILTVLETESGRPCINLVSPEDYLGNNWSAKMDDSVIFGKFIPIKYMAHVTWVNVPNIKPVLFRIYVPKLKCSEHTYPQN